ncbi:B3 domain-containing protein Os01g0234100-like isoform X2 [Panicum hallii]|uniref:B3 domain-containing protein Os01g0234100-like isoform X2 n=1 Tax=Panicum hallii TaxID=206008 RepID=UPI000DF4DBE4|nr:B3 domain-containing protein Os01g0234100-like isoform X2 [Panicum hallii]
MAMDPPLKRKRGRPSGSQSAKSKMEQKMALVKQRLALLDSASSSSAEIDKDDDFVPMDDELTIVAAHQPIEIDYGDTYNEDEVLASKGLESEKRRLPGQNISASYGSVMDRAVEVQAKLPPEHPSFVKRMLQSHVVRGFWLGLPTYFCNKHLPKEDTGIVLEDQNGQDHQTLYLGVKQGLSAGWRGFAIKHDIKVGDVVIFQLVRSTKFKVYIIRANEFTTADGAISLLNLEVHKKGKLSKKGCFDDAKSREAEKASPVDDKVPAPQSDDNNAVVSEAIDGLRISADSDMDFGDVTSFSNFNIVVDSLVIDCKFHDHLRRTYYELCCSQKSFLHKNLLKQLNLALVVGVIMETISIAEGIRACKAQAPSREDLVIWKKTLESLELLGMNVAFLLKRINDLLGLPAGARDLSECQKYKELKSERAHAGEKVKVLELMLLNVKGVLQKMDAEMEEMESSVKRSGLMLQQLATAPW